MFIEVQVKLTIPGLAKSTYLGFTDFSAVASAGTRGGPDEASEDSQ